MIRRSLLAGAVAMLAVPLLAGCEAGLNAPTLEFHQASSGAHAVIDGISISNAYVLAAPSGSSLPAGSRAGLFLGLWNNGSSSDALTSVFVSSQVASGTTITGKSIALAPNSGANLTGPSPKVVLDDLAEPLAGGQSVEVTLTFRNAGSVTMEVPVEPQSYYYSTFSQPPSATPTASAPGSSKGSSSATPAK